ncbi:MAG: hypothetical protein GX194_11070 [Clostridium sp.]|nr:hypothetical protein [Clostridium sp.]
MTKEYVPNAKRAEAMLNKYHKKHDMWKKRKVVRIIMHLLCIFGPIFMVLYVYNDRDYLYLGNNDIIDQIFVLVLVSILFLWTPTIIYYKQLVAKCRKTLTFKLRESLILYDDMIKNGFSFPSRDKRDPYMINEIKYSEITRLVHNTYLNRLTLYCLVHQIIYDDYGANSVYSDKAIRNERIDFILYYDNSDDFVKTVAERSEVELEVIDHFEK